MTEVQKYIIIGFVLLVVTVIQLAASLNKNRFFGIVLPIVSLFVASAAALIKYGVLFSGNIFDVLRFFWFFFLYNAVTILYTAIYILCRMKKGEIRKKKKQQAAEELVRRRRLEAEAQQARLEEMNKREARCKAAQQRREKRRQGWDNFLSSFSKEK